MLLFGLALLSIMLVDDVWTWLEGRPQNFAGIILAPIFNPVFIFIDCVFIYMIWRRIKHSRKTIKDLKWR
jgi:hypothetical protein